MKSKIKWQEPPEHQPEHKHPTVKAIVKRHDEWALAATVGPNEVPEWWAEVIFDPYFKYQIRSQDPTDPESLRDVYVMYKTKPHEHYVVPSSPSDVVTTAQTHQHLDISEE